MTLQICGRKNNHIPSTLWPHSCKTCIIHYRYSSWMIWHKRGVDKNVRKQTTPRIYAILKVDYFWHKRVDVRQVMTYYNIAPTQNSLHKSDQTLVNRFVFRIDISRLHKMYLWIFKKCQSFITIKLLVLVYKLGIFC